MDAHVHLPDHLAQHAAQEAERLRISLDDLILVAVHDFTEQPSDRKTRLLAEVSAFVERHFSPESFPPNATLRVFHHIRSDARLRSLYDAETRDLYGHVDDFARASLNHAISTTVANRLSAEVIGHLSPLDPDTELTETCQLLRPTQ
jgi:hypothetical protein